MRVILFVMLSTFLLSCSDKPSNMDQLQLLSHIKELESDVKVMVPPSLDKPLVFCYEYKPACQQGYKVKIKGLEVTALYYEDQSNAKKSAKSVRGYLFRNWVFDQVRDEPILERFFENQVKAKKMF